MELTSKESSRTTSTPRSRGAERTTMLKACVILLILSAISGCAGPRDEDGADGGFPEVVVASGYVQDVLAAGDGIAAMYDAMEGASDAVEETDLVVAGYLVDIVPGVVFDDLRAYRRMTQAEIDEYLASIAQSEVSLREAGQLGPREIASLKREREAVLENAEPKGFDEVHVAYRVRVTEVLSGEFEVGEILDVQVPLGAFVSLPELREALVGTPRAVVGGVWSKKAWGGYALVDAAGAPVTEKVFFPWIELFWLDESVWDLADVGSEPGSTGSVDDGSEGGEAPGGLLDDDDPPVAQTGAGDVFERPVGDAEALHLGGLDDLHPAWGVLETLDDLADAIRTAAKNKAAQDPTPTTTAATQPEATTSTSTTLGSAHSSTPDSTPATSTTVATTTSVAAPGAG